MSDTRSYKRMPQHSWERNIKLVWTHQEKRRRQPLTIMIDMIVSGIEEGSGLDGDDLTRPGRI